jgi:hypothetical protein
LSAAWRAACAPFLERDISTVTWSEVEAFPDEMAKINPTRVPSPVFTSKFCHFLLPRVFPVVDNAAIGGRWQTYGDYFKFVQDEWNTTDPEPLREIKWREVLGIPQERPSPLAERHVVDAGNAPRVELMLDVGLPAGVGGDDQDAVWEVWVRDLVALQQEATAQHPLEEWCGRPAPR